MPRSPYGDACVQAFMLDSSEPFVKLAGDDDDAAALAGLSSPIPGTTTDRQREQVLWSVQHRINMERTEGEGTPKQRKARSFTAIGRHHYKPKSGVFEPDRAVQAMKDAINGEAGPNITVAAKALFELMTDEEKTQTVAGAESKLPPKKSGG
jgi:hypothetical protein